MRRFWVAAFLSSLISIAPAMAQDQTVLNINMLRSKAVEAQFMGRPESAMANYQAAVDLARKEFGANSPFLAELYYDMGSLCLTNSQFPKADEYLSQTIKLNPNSAAAHLRMAELKRVQGKGDEAIRHASYVVSKHRDDAVARQELAMAYERNDDQLRAYHELSAMEQLVQHNKQMYEGRESSPSFLPKISFAPQTQIKLNVAPTLPVAKLAPAKDDKAELAKKKAEEERKKILEKAEKLIKQQAEQEKKKAQIKADQEKRKAQQKALQEKKKAEQATKKPAPAKPVTTTAAAADPVGQKASLSSKAVLLTPVKKPPVEKKTPAPKPVVVEESEENSGGIDEEAPKKAAPAPVPKPVKVEPVKPKPGKHAPGLVPPPPPVMTFPVMPPPPATPPAKPKAQPPAPKKEEKTKEAAPAVKEEKEKGGADEDDFLLDWGGAGKPKGKK